MHNQGKCQEEPKHVTPLSQRDASAQERQQEQALTGGKMNNSWNVTRPTQSHVSSLHVLVLLLCAQVIWLVEHCS